MNEPNPVLSADPSDCPYDVEEINEYLDLEDYDRQKTSLRFVFRAQCADRTYWAWSYLDEAGAIIHAVLTRMHETEEVIIGCGAFENASAPHDVLVLEMLEKNV